MESQLHHAIGMFGRVCSTVISAKPIYLDQSLCSRLADCLKFAAQQLTEVQNEIESVVQEYPDLFRELNIVAYRAHILVERCCTKEWLRTLFLQACTSHKEEALDVIDDLEWCLAEIWKISRFPRQQSQSLLKFKESLGECEDLDRRNLLKQLESHGSVLKECECLSDRRELLKQLKSHGLILKESEDLGRRELVKQLESHTLLPLVRQELQLTKYLLGRIKVQVAASTPRAIASSAPRVIEVSLDYRNFYPIGANGFSGSVLLGQGSAAKVYKTKFLGVQCAKKVQTAITADELQGLAKQASKLAPLSHPHVMKLLGYHEDKRTDEGIYEGHWLMECMDGDLRDNIRQYLNQYPIAVDVMLKIAKGVRYLHENGIAHRDLKCCNVLVRKTPISSKASTSAYMDYFHVKVTDFDQSKFFTNNSSDLQVQSKPHVGSTPWKAPETFIERARKSSVHMVNPKSADSYSFAMTCFELLSGENPFEAMPGISWTEAKAALIAGRRPPLPKDCPELLRDLIVECWRTNPMQRPDFPEICRRLQDIRAFLLTGSLTQRNRQRDALSFFRHNAQRVVSVFKNMRMAVSTTRKQIPVLRVTLPETQAPFTHSDLLENVQHVPEGYLLSTQDPSPDHRILKTAKLVVGLDFGTTHTGVAYAMVSNPDEIFTICHWPLVGEEVYHCKTLTAIYKSSPNGDCVWGYPARREYEKEGRGNGRSSGFGSYFGELKQSLSSNKVGLDLQPAVEYLRELGKFVLGYLQHLYPRELLEMDLLRWCITVPSDWDSDSRQNLGTCLVNAGLVRGGIENENLLSSFDIFLESDAAACYCNANFTHVNMKKGDRLCVLDVGGGNVQCVFEDWEGSGQWSYEGTQKVYSVRPSCVESLVQDNFLKFLLGDGHPCYSFRQLMRSDPSIWMSLLDELDALKVDLNHSIKIPSDLTTHLESDEHSRLENSTVMDDNHDSQCALNTQPSDELCPSSSDTKFIFKPLVDGVLSFLQEQLQSEPNVKRLFLVGGYAKHVYFMEEIRRSFPNLRIDMPKNPGSAVCKGAVALGLKLYFEFQSGLTKDTLLNSEGGEQGTSHEDEKSNGNNHQDDQSASSEKADPNSHSYSRFGGASDTKSSKQVDSEDQMDVDSLREKVLVALDFGTSQIGFAYGFKSQPGEITVCEEDQRRSTDLFYKLYHDTLRFHSCGQKAKDDIGNDFNQQPDDSQEFVPAQGAYISKPKLHLVVDNADPEVELHLPVSLTIDDVISDCLREYGHFVLELLQRKFGKDFKLRHIQWCLLMPSFWGENTKRRIEACMTSAGLLRGPSCVDGSTYPLVTVLEAEAASMACINSLSLYKGYRFLIVSIGGGTVDMVIQEWIGELGMHDMKEVGMSSGGFYGSSCLDINFLALLSIKLGAWVSDYLEHFPLVLINLMSQWERIKVGYSDDCNLKLYILHLPMQLQNVWRSFEYQSATCDARSSYESLELTSDDVKMLFEPVVRTILEQIGAQLATSCYVNAVVVVGGFTRSPYLYGQIVRKFGDRCLLRIANTESMVLRGAILFAQHPKGIRSRIARKTYGLGMSTDLEPRLCQTGEISNEVERFHIGVEKWTCLGVDYYVESYHQPISPLQKSMKFSLYSSDESYPLYTGEQSVTKEWDFVVDISDLLNSKDEPNIRIRLYYGRSAVKVVAEAMKFGEGKQLPVTFAIGAHNVKKPLDANVAKKTYGVGSSKCFEMWDLPEYRNTHGVDQGDTCDFNFEVYIQRGTPLDSFVSRTYSPIYNKQRSLSFTLYSSMDVSPTYITDETAMEEGDFEVDIRKGLYLDKDREISLRMCFTLTKIKISAVALNFAGEDRNLPIRLRYGNWESKVNLALARQLRMVPLQPSSLMREKRSQRKALVLAMPEISRQPDEGGSWVSEGSTRDILLFDATTSQPSQSEETHAVHPFHEHLEPLYESFVCPLTKQMMEDPVSLENGQTYERVAVEHWLKESEENGRPALCPMTGQKVDTTMKPSLALRNTIEEWTARNEQARIEIVKQIVTSGSSDDDIVFGLTDLQTLCRKNRMNKHRVRQEDLIPLIVDLLRNGEEVRCLALSTLRLLAEDNEDNKEAIGATNLSRVVKCLSQELTREREGAVYLLYELSKSYSLSSKIGATNGAMFTLAEMLSSNSENGAVIQHAELALANLKQCDDNENQMAENGCLQPLLERLVEGPTEERLREDIEALMREHREGSRSGTELAMESVAGSLDLRSEETITEEIKGFKKEREEACMEKDRFVEELFDQALQLVNQKNELLKGAAAMDDLEIPAEFCCPLSGKLMSDPVILASGQTFERIFIQHWLREDHTMCPKTRQKLSHRSLIPNYTAKALIACWCKRHHLPVPTCPDTSKLRLLPADADLEFPRPTGTTPSGFRSFKRPMMLKCGSLRARESWQPTKICGSGELAERASSSGRLWGDEGAPFQSVRDLKLLPKTASKDILLKLLYPKTQTNSHAQIRLDLFSGSGNRVGSVSVNEELGSPARQPEKPMLQPPEVDMDISLPRIFPNTSAVVSSAQSDVERLVQDLQSLEIGRQRQAACELRMLAKHDMENRVMIANSGAIEPLVLLLNSEDGIAQVNAVTALLNLSINDDNKVKIAGAGAIGPLVNLLSVGSSEATENAAATLFSLSVMDVCKVTIGASGAIRPLVHLVINGSPRGKKDACVALFNLSIYHENKIRILQAGAIRPLVELMADPAAGMVDKAVAVLANMATIPEGRQAIGDNQGIQALVEVVEIGSERVKDNAAAALLQLCVNSHRHCAWVLQEGAIPPLVALSQSGTPRAKEKASALLRYFQEQGLGRKKGR